MKDKAKGIPMKGPPSSRISDLSIIFIIANYNKKAIVIHRRQKMNIYYRPKIDQKEKEIIAEVFGKENISYGEYKTKGIEGGIYDVQIIIDTLNDPWVAAAIKSGNFLLLMYQFIKILFKRNNKKIENNNTRPRYTILTIRRKRKFINISNINKNNKITISETSTSFKFKEEEYSDKKLKEYF